MKLILTISLAPVATLLSFIVCSTTILASDGQLEINQACAVNTGCFTGDAPGFPVTITQPGSYRLTGNLDLGAQDPALSGIDVSSPGVTVDLAGFQIAGPTRCSGSGASLSCSPAGANGGWGVLFQEGATASVVRNGIVRNMANAGIGSAATGTRVEHITANHNGIDGIGAQEGTLVVNCVALENGSDGIDVDAGSIVDAVTAIGNGKDGIEVDGPGGVVTRSTARNNGERGFNLAAYTEFQTNVSGSNVVKDRCGGGICTQARRYYLSPNVRSGDIAQSACAPGFHMASLWEILDVSVLAYDTALGVLADDSGRGPPSDSIGWIRTGSSENFGTTAGTANCNAWSSLGSGSLAGGTYAALTRTWKNPATEVSAWETGASHCGSNLNVWCVED